MVKKDISDFSCSPTCILSMLRLGGNPEEEMMSIKVTVGTQKETIAMYIYIYNIYIYIYIYIYNYISVCVLSATSQW